MSSIPGDLLATLNDAQKQVVLHDEGPLLVLACAGAGKTGSFTRRIARLVLEKKAATSEILAITFTNKAAKEIQDRVALWLGKRAAASIQLSTFHSFAHKLLRSFIGQVPSLKRTAGYSILDRSPQLREITKVIKDLGLDTKDHKAQVYSDYIQKAKARGEFPWLAEYPDTPPMLKIPQVAEAYEKRLRALNSVDFGDLLMLTVYIMGKREDLRQQAADRFRFIMVDEYQDTNPVQLMLLDLLTRTNKNIAVVGDDSQCIYGFNGANINTILDFPRDHPGCKTITLNQNYRSTARIVVAAQQLLTRNKKGFKKNSFSADVRSGVLELLSFKGDREESERIGDLIETLIRNGHPRHEIAVLYRVNAQSRQLEMQMVRRGIPYQIKGGFKFYDREEVRDILSWAKIFVNPADDAAWERAITTPPRGIGETTIKAVEDYARQHLLSFREALQECHLYLKPAATKKIENFMQLYNKLVLRFKAESPLQFIASLIQEIEFETYIKGPDLNTMSPEAKSRWGNVRELTAAIRQYEVNVRAEDTHPTLGGFLDQVALIAEEVGQDPEKSEVVNLMTAHASKGLEFKTVIIAGVEESLFPLGTDDVEEERRLFYVAMTRAKENLYFTKVDTRYLYGTPKNNEISRFIGEAFDRR